MKKILMLITMLITTALVFALTVDGYVTDVVTGEAIEGATVKFVLVDGTGGGCGGGGCGGGNGGGGGGCAVVTVTTDANGYYVITDFEAGIYNGMANKPGSYPCVNIEDIEITEDVTINFELEEGGCLTPENVFESKRTTKTR